MALAQDSGFEVEVILMRNRQRALRTMIDGVNITSLPTSLNRSSRYRYLQDYLVFFLLVSSMLTTRHVRRRLVHAVSRRLPAGRRQAGR